MILNLDRANWFVLTGFLRKAECWTWAPAWEPTLMRWRSDTAVEPVAERVQFMGERFRQEGISNVHILQTLSGIFHLEARVSTWS